MIEKGPAEGRVEKMVGERELLGEPPLREAAAVVIAHDEPAGAGDGGETIHPAAVDLLLLLIEVMGEIGGLVAVGSEGVDRERRVGQSCGKRGSTLLSAGSAEASRGPSRRRRPA